MWALANVKRSAPARRLIVDLDDAEFRVRRAGVLRHLDVTCVNALVLEPDNNETELLPLLKSLTKNGMARWPPGTLEVVVQYARGECCLLLSVDGGNGACVLRIATGVFDAV